MEEIVWPLIIPVDDREYWDGATEDERATATAWATAIMWALSGRVYGVVDDLVRPHHRPPRRGNTYDGTLNGGRAGVYAAGGLLLAGITGLYPTGCRCGVEDCRHQTAADLALPGPIVEVTRIAIDGVEVPADTYAIRNRRWVRRRDGRSWPTRQDLNALDNEPGAFVVAYKRGIVPPQAGQLAAGIMAVEWLKDRDGRECRLPRGVVSANRNGLQVDLDPRAYFTEGMTGIEDVDQWLLSVNPNRVAAPAQMVRPHPLVSRLAQ